MEQYSPPPVKSFAFEINESGIIVDEDVDTQAMGYRWLHSNCAQKAFLPRHSTFVTEKLAHGRMYHSSQLVLERNSVEKLPSSILEHMLWALENEGFELQILKMTIYNVREKLAEEMLNVTDETRISDSFRRVWFLYEYFAESVIPMKDVLPSVEPILLLDPTIYVAGPCWNLTDRQRYVLS